MSDLPATWRFALRTCPYCAGIRSACMHCNGTGDLFAALLEVAYRRGRDDALAAMRETYAVAKLAGEQVRDMPVPDLRVVVGLGRVS